MIFFGAEVGNAFGRGGNEVRIGWGSEDHTGFPPEIGVFFGRGIAFGIVLTPGCVQIGTGRTSGSGGSGLPVGRGLMPGSV